MSLRSERPRVFPQRRSRWRISRPSKRWWGPHATSMKNWRRSCVAMEANCTRRFWCFEVRNPATQHRFSQPGTRLHSCRQFPEGNSRSGRGHEPSHQVRQMEPPQRMEPRGRRRRQSNRAAEARAEGATGNAAAAKGTRCLVHYGKISLCGDYQTGKEQ